jgi:serine/threonine protein kinase
MHVRMQVLTHIADRLTDLHAAGYVHRDVKPGNVMWLPRTKRWTLIDFGCVAKTNEHASIGFSFSYAAPEAIRAHSSADPTILVTEALDAWSVGILAIEIFTGQPVWDIMQEREQVRASARAACMHVWLQCSAAEIAVIRPLDGSASLVPGGAEWLLHA